MNRSIIHHLSVLALAASSALVAVGFGARAAQADSSLSVFSGVLSTPAGDPIGAVTISLTSTSGNGGQTESAPDGSFAVDVVPGVYTLGMSSPGNGSLPDFAIATGPSIDLRGADVTQNLTLPLARQRVTVLDATGTPIQGATVEVPDSDAGVQVVPGGEVDNAQVFDTTAETDAAGVATLPTLVGAGPVIGTATGPQDSPLISFQDPEITATPFDLTVRFPGTATFSGVIRTSSGQPVAGLKLRLTSPDSTEGGSGSTADDGSFAIQAPLGPYNMSMIGESGGDVPNFEIDTLGVDLSQGDVTQDMTLPIATVNVTVLDASGAPESGATVLVPQTTATFAPYPGTQVQATVYDEFAASDGNGLASYPAFIGTAGGNGTVTSAQGTGINVQIPQVTTDPTDITVQFPAPVTFSGSITTPSGQPLDGIGLSLFSLSGGPSTQTSTDGAGRFSIQLAPDHYQLGISGTTPVFDLQTGVDATQGDVTKNYTLPIENASITVVDGNDTPVPGATIATTGYSSADVDLGPGNGTVQVDLRPQSVTTDGNGVAQFPTFLGADGYAATVTAPTGNPTISYFVPAIDTDPMNLTVQLPGKVVTLATSTTLTSSANPLTLGQSATITATVTAPTRGADAPSGTLAFTVDGTTENPVALGSDGTAKLDISSLPPGTHTISAAYSGDDVYAASSTVPLDQTVQQPTTTALSVAPAGPVTQGTNVTLTATESPAGAGSMQFYDGATAVGGPVQVDASAGTATLTTSALATGSHSLTAAFTPTVPGYQASTSPAVSLQVTAPGIAIGQTITKQGAGTVTTSPFSTTGPRLLVAFTSSDGPATRQTTTVTGAGLTWTLAQRANTKGGTAEIWTAYATTPLTAATVTSTPKTAGYDQQLTVEVLTGATGIGAGTVAGKANGAPAVSLTTTAAHSWVFAVGEDYTHAATIIPGPSQSVLQQDLDTAHGDTFWVQDQNSPTPAAGTKVTMNDTAPTADTWNLAAVEILAAG